MQILVVDDDSIDREMLRISLDEAGKGGYDISEATSVESALALIEQQRFDVIVLDYRMPGADGIELVIEIRSKPRLGGTAIVMTSGEDDDSLALECIEAGAQDFISKEDITRGKLEKALLHAQKRFEIEQRMHQSYLQVKELAEKDPLTGLSNRYHFEESIKVVIANNQRTGASVALLALDLDDFKDINDTLGHSAGDQVLKEAVRRVSMCLRNNEGFARIGGDEFAITLSNISSISVITIVANRIKKAFNAPFMVEGREVRCGISIGAALCPADANESQGLLKCADIAMYRAKQKGKNQVCFYELHYQEEFNRRFDIQNAMRNIMEHASFRLVYQAIFSTETRAIIGFEALIRWPAAHGAYTPDEFIPIAEESRLILDLGRWIIKTAIEQVAHWKREHKKELSISINISPVQLSDPELVSYIVKVADLAKISNRDVILEITETALIKDNEKISQSLKALSDLGFRIALDDFGMGYSSVSHLLHFPIHIVKLDKSLQLADANEGKQYGLLKGLSLMLASMDFTVVAEGVETEAQLQTCAKLNIDRAQGYLLAKPSEPTDIEKLF
ncbi:putative bifunctional diguanylate cyclase/phosphodiesterase [Agaribacter flavus]|uniref:Bifunctional diguanylate cyclase/phosphodiesterase n=1 Tax=Agaribacter flavus TaxID=1902781 RepID=A0ABV7FN22_9ALTE